MFLKLYCPHFGKEVTRQSSDSARVPGPHCAKTVDFPADRLAPETLIGGYRIMDLVGSGAFREDLLYRVDVIPIRRPPLRERADDIPLLVSHLLGKICAASGREPLSVSPAAMEELQLYCWPGNVRQLINTLEYGFITCRAGAIDVGDLPAHLFRDLSCRRADGSRGGRPGEAEIRAALERTGWSRTRAAEALGISRVTLWKKIKQFGLS